MIGVLIVEHIERLLKYALILTKNTDHAQDILQSAIVRALERAHLLESKDAFLKWMNRIILNVFINEFNRNRMQKEKHKVIQEEKRMLNSIEEKWANPEVLVLRQFEWERVHACLKQIPEHYRAILVGYYFYEMSIKEIAESLDISQGTAASRLYRGRQYLLQLLGTHQFSTKESSS